jgi:hypothetical protein
MSFIANPAFQAHLRKVLDADAAFVEQTRWFDGSVLLQAGSDRLWLKIYCGKVIDQRT